MAALRQQKRLSLTFAVETKKKCYHSQNSDALCLVLLLLPELFSYSKNMSDN